MSDEPRKLTCIGCPLGCQLLVEHHGDEAWRVRGFQCKQGKEYGVQEVREVCLGRRVLPVIDGLT